MSIVHCNNFHYYDDEKYAACPFCAEAGSGALPDPGSGGLEDERTSAFLNEGGEDQTVGSWDLDPCERGASSEKTVGYMEERLHLDPVVGWLVCVKGEEKGRDYRLHAGRNFVGRAEHMDVAIYDDPEVSREDHCSLIYDPLHGDYLLFPGSGGATFFDGNPVREPVLLRDGGEIGIGGALFIFIAFCKGGQSWGLTTDQT